MRSSRGSRWPLENRTAALLSLVRLAVAAADPDEALRKMAMEAAALFGASGCIIRVAEGDVFRVGASFGVTGDMEEKGPACTEGSVEKSGSSVCAPLKAGDRTVGTLELSGRKGPDGAPLDFTDDDMDVLSDVTSIAALAADRCVRWSESQKREQEAREARREVEELKKYLEGLIENSADAIVVSDLSGIITSWNKGAEKIYGFAADEVIGTFLPFVPDFIMDVEREYMESVSRGEVIKDIETIRKAADGRIIDVTVTLSPVRNARGAIIGISSISRDVTERKRIEKELMRKSDELSRVFFIASAMRGTLELDKLLRMVLTAVTMGDGLGFNRAILFLVDEGRGILKGAMGVGPSSHEEAWEIWSRLSMERKDLHSLMREIERSPLRKDSFMERLCSTLEIGLDTNTILTKAAREKRAFNVTDVNAEPFSDGILIQYLGTTAYAVVPLISRDKVIGILWVDNLYSKRQITANDMEFLKGFTDQIASAVENARLFEQVAQAEQELENIFESISDFVYIIGSDFTIRKVNRAVLEGLGKGESEIIGRKCYEVFHGLHEPWERCPHLRTISMREPFIEEVDDFIRPGETHLVSSSPIISKAGELTGTVHIVRDVTEIRKLREQVAAAERMAALGEMAARVAHEIRNPLLSIGGFARRLERSLNRELREYAKIVVDEVTRLEGILNDTLSFVRSGRMQIRDVDVAGFIDDVVNLLEPAVHEKGNVLVREVPRTFTVSVDPDRFREVIINIVTNANQATDNGRITISAYRRVAGNGSGNFTRTEAVIEISDTGCGIRTEDLCRIFDPFFTTRPTGTGLGLSITKRIVEEHGARIDVTSTWGKGTTFRIYLPIQEVAA